MKKIINLLVLLFVIFIAGCSSGGSSGNSSGGGTPISDNQMIEFSLNGTVGVIDQNNNTIAVAMPYGTSDVSNLTATYLTDGGSVTVNGVNQVDGVTPNDFTNPVTYTVHAANGDTRDYVVTVTIQPVISQATAISFAGNYAFLTSNVSSDITKCSVTNESQLTACSNISVGNLLPQGAAGISAFESTGGMTLFITGNDNPPSIIQCLVPTGAVTATCSKINAADGLQSRRLLSVSTPDPSSSAKITSFAVNGVSGRIYLDHIYVTLPYGASLNGLVATFTTTGKSVKVNNVVQTSGVTTNNFTDDVPVQYVVTAKDNTTKTYYVYVRWTAFVGIVLNPYVPSVINAPLVYSRYENEMDNLYVTIQDGLYSALNFRQITSFPVGVNANGLSSIAVPKTTTNESYNYVMTNIAESKIYACFVNGNASEISDCSTLEVDQPSSAVTSTVPGLPFVFLYVASYHQNKLSIYSVVPSTHAIAAADEIDMTGVFNLPRSLSAIGGLLFALNDGDNSYVVCPITDPNFTPALCRKTYFSSL